MVITPAQLEEWKRLCRETPDPWSQLDQMRTALPALIAEVERLRAEAEWRDIATAPRDGTPVLVWVRNHADIAIWKHNILDGWLWNLRREGFFSDRWSEQPTHWRPITPPKDSTNE